MCKRDPQICPACFAPYMDFSCDLLYEDHTKNRKHFGATPLSTALLGHSTGRHYFFPWSPMAVVVLLLLLRLVEVSQA